MITLAVVARGVTEKERPLYEGQIVQYLGHVPGGMVSIKFPDGAKDIAHPGCFKELR